MAEKSQHDWPVAIETHRHLVHADARGKAEVNPVVVINLKVEIGRGHYQVRMSVQMPFDFLASAENVLP